MSKRRAWIIAITCLLLPVVAVIGWQFRPLNSAERRLVGVWAAAATPEEKIRFGADRKYAMNTFGLYTLATGTEEIVHGELQEVGSWTASSAAVQLEFDATPLAERLQDAVMRIFGDSDETPVRFEGEDRLWLGGDAYVRAAE